MPSGYTEQIYDGKVSTLKEWLKQKWIPLYEDEIRLITDELSYHNDQITAYSEEFEAFRAKTQEELRADYQEYLENSLKKNIEIEHNSNTLESRYVSIQNELKAVNLSGYSDIVQEVFGYMEGYLRDSIDYDCVHPHVMESLEDLVSFDEYCKDRENGISYDIQYHIRRHAEVTERLATHVEIKAAMEKVAND